MYGASACLACPISHKVVKKAERNGQLDILYANRTLFHTHSFCYKSLITIWWDQLMIFHCWYHKSLSFFHHLFYSNCSFSFLLLAPSFAGVKLKVYCYPIIEILSIKLICVLSIISILRTVLPKYKKEINHPFLPINKARNQNNFVTTKKNSQKLLSWNYSGMIVSKLCRILVLFWKKFSKTFLVFE